MRWRILGPVEVEVDGRVLRIQRPQERAVVAHLLLNANHVVPTERLIYALWGDAAPAAARAQVQVCVSHIRQALLRDGANGVLTTRLGGYRLAVASGELDLDEFTAGVTRARTAATAGDPTTAADLLRAALALWRGQALTGAAGVFVDTAATRLEERRLAAVEELADIELSLGRHLTLADELDAFVDAHPLRERLVGQLMLALAGCGRQAQALELYIATRSRLTDALGIEPSPELTDIHLRILRQQVSEIAKHHDTNSGAPASRPAPPVPAQLPPDVAAFTGRAAHLHHLDALLPAEDQAATAVVISAIAGTAGIGKTSLAVHWAHRIAHRFPDGQLYVNLRGYDPAGTPTTPTEAIRGFLDAFAVPPQRIPASLDAQIGLCRSLLAGKRVLLLLDNARDADQVRPLLPGSPGCLVVVTSRNQLTSLVAAEGAHPVTLDLLTHDEARDLLTRRLGPDRVAAEPDAVDQLITLCSRLPLALSIVAARAATRPTFPLTLLASELRDARDSLDPFIGEDPKTDIRAIFSWSYHAVSAPAARLFRLLGLHPGPEVSAAAAASTAGIPLPQIRPLLAELTRTHMLVEPAPGRYSFHDLLRTYATELTHAIDAATERRTALHRLLDHYLHTALRAALLLRPCLPTIPLTPVQPGVIPENLTDHTRALAWFTAEHCVLLAVCRHAATNGRDRHAWQLAFTIKFFLHRRGHWHDWISIQQAGLDAAHRIGDRTGQAHSHHDLARVLAQLGRYEEARIHLEHAFDLFTLLGDASGLAAAATGFNHVYGRQGLHREALRPALRALALYRSAGDRYGEANALNNAGWTYAHLGDYRQALTCCQQALSLVQELDVVSTVMANTWDSLGHVRHHLGHHDQAIICYQRALAVFQEIGDLHDEARTLDRLGDTHHAVGDLDSARHAWQRALKIHDELGHHDADQVRAKLQRLGPANRASPNAA